MATDPVGYIFGGTSGVPTYEELKRRRAIAVALASRQRGFPKTVGEGMTYLGESIGDMLADRRLTAMEREAGLAGAANLAALRGSSGYEPGTAPASPAAPRPPTPPPVRPPAAPMPPRPAPAAPPATTVAPAPSITAIPVRPTPADPYGATEGTGEGFEPGSILNPAPVAVPPEGVTSQAGPSSGYLPPTATAAAPPSNAPAPAAAPTANELDTAEWPAGPVNAPPTSELNPIEVPRRLPATAGPQSSAAPPPAGDTPPNVLAQAQEVALQGGPAAVSRFMADAGYPKSGAWCGQFAAAVASSAGVQPPAGPAVASNWRNVGTPVNTPQVGDVAIARPGWSRRGSGETGEVGSHVTFVNQSDPSGTFQGLGGNQGRMVKPFNAADFEFRRLPGDVQGHRIVGIPGEEQPNAQVAAYAAGGGVSDAPVPGMGGAGSPRLAPQIPPLQGPPPAPEEQVTPTNIEPMPATAQFGPPVGRFSRTDAPVPGVAAAPPQAPAAAPPPTPQGPPPATYVGSTPSAEPIPPAQPQTMEAPGAPPVRNYPGGRPLSARQQRAMQIMQNPTSDLATAGAAEQIFKVEEEFRKRAETQDESDYAAARSQHFQKSHEFEKFRREEADRAIKQQSERTALEKTRAELEEKYYNQGLPRQQAADKARLEIIQKQQEVAVGKAPQHATMNEVPVQWDQATNTWREIDVKKLPAGEGPPTVKLTKEQSDELQHLTKVRIALDQYGRVRDADKILAEGLKDELAGKLPFFGNAALSEKYRVVRNAASNFLQGHLRSTSGAAIGAQEMATHYSSLVPLYGDDPVTIRNKQQQREGIAQGMYVGLGSARPLFDYTVAQRQKEDATEQEKIRREMPTNPEVGKIYKNEKGRRRYWTGSRWEDD